MDFPIDNQALERGKVFKVDHRVVCDPFRKIKLVARRTRID